jgi:hypothetical protein
MRTQCMLFLTALFFRLALDDLFLFVNVFRTRKNQKRHRCSLDYQSILRNCLPLHQIYPRRYLSNRSGHFTIRMEGLTILTLLLVYCIRVLHGERSISNTQCYAPSVVDFVKDSLPKLCFGSDTAGYLNYTMNDVEFYNAHCRIYQEIKDCLETKLKHCEEIRNGFHRHVLNLVESYQLPLEYFDYDATVFDDDHYMQNLIPFCDGAKLSSRTRDMSLLIAIAVLFSSSFLREIRSIIAELFK